jgi:hypothetical protein
MKRIWRRLLSFYFRIVGQYQHRRLDPTDGPMQIEIFRGFKVQSHSSRFSGVQQRYLRASSAIGDAVSYLYMGECIGFSDLLAEWQEAEREYAAVGFRTFPIEDLNGFGGWGKDLNGIGMLRAVDEKPVYHAALYRQHYYGKPVPMHVEQHDGGVVSGRWLPPRTSDLNEDET